MRICEIENATRGPLIFALVGALNLHGLCTDERVDQNTKSRRRPLLNVAIGVAAIPCGVSYTVVFTLEILNLIFGHMAFSIADLLSNGRLAARLPLVKPIERLSGRESPRADARLVHVPSSSDVCSQNYARYVGLDSVWTALQDGTDVKPRDRDVRLLRLSWLMDLGTEGTAVNKRYNGVLNRRQDLPEEAFIEVEELKKIERRANWGVKGLGDFLIELFVQALAGPGGMLIRLGRCLIDLATLRGLTGKRNPDELLPIVAISYVRRFSAQPATAAAHADRDPTSLRLQCWLEPHHPDSNGTQVALLCSRLQQVGEGRGRFRGLLGRFRAYGFRDAGVFLDWGSLFQKDPDLFDPKETPDAKSGAERDRFNLELQEGTKHYGGEPYYESRSMEDCKRMHRALDDTMDLWYGHAGTTVVLLTELPQKVPEDFDVTRTYESRGWTTFERCSAELGKKTTSQWRLVIDAKYVRRGATRRLPTTPSMMEKLLETRSFTNGADNAKVFKLYKKTATAILGGIKTLNFSGMQFETTDARLEEDWRSPARLALALGLCDGLERLSLAATGLTDDHLVALEAHLPPESLPRMKELLLALNPIGATGVQSIGAILTAGCAPELRILGLGALKQADEVAKELANVLMTVEKTNHPRVIILAASNVGSVGALALAAAIKESRSTTRFLLMANEIPLRARVALVRARDSTGKGSRSDYIEFLASQLGNALTPSILYRGTFITIKRRIEREGRVVCEDAPPPPRKMSLAVFTTAFIAKLPTGQGRQSREKSRQQGQVRV